MKPLFLRSLSLAERYREHWLDALAVLLNHRLPDAVSITRAIGVDQVDALHMGQINDPEAAIAGVVLEGSRHR